MSADLSARYVALPHLAKNEKFSKRLEVVIAKTKEPETRTDTKVTKPLRDAATNTSWRESFRLRRTQISNLNRRTVLLLIVGCTIGFIVIVSLIVGVTVLLVPRRNNADSDGKVSSNIFPNPYPPEVLSKRTAVQNSFGFPVILMNSNEEYLPNLESFRSNAVWLQEWKVMINGEDGVALGLPPILLPRQFGGHVVRMELWRWETKLRVHLEYDSSTPQGTEPITVNARVSIRITHRPSASQKGPTEMALVGRCRVTSFWCDLAIFENLAWYDFHEDWPPFLKLQLLPS